MNNFSFRVRRAVDNAIDGNEETTEEPVEPTESGAAVESRSSVHQSDKRTTRMSRLTTDFRTSVSPSELTISEPPPPSASSTNDKNDLIDLMAKSKFPDLLTSEPSVPKVGLLKEGTPRVFGIRVQAHSKGISYEGDTALLQANYDAQLLLLGQGLTNDTHIQFTAKSDDAGGKCFISTSEIFKVR